MREWNIPRVPDLCRKHGVADSGFHMNFLRIQIFREFMDVETAKVTSRKQLGDEAANCGTMDPVKSNSSDARHPSLGCPQRVARRGKMGIPYGDTYQRLE